MKILLPLCLSLLLCACAWVTPYLDGTYNAAAFPPLDAPADSVALVGRAADDARGAAVLTLVDDIPIKVKPDGSGDGLWAKQVALAPGEHALVTSWRRPGEYSPSSSLCQAEFLAGHQYLVNYEVAASGREARVWLSDAADAGSTVNCAARKPPPMPQWPF
ncbi:MAG TPA: hypothetical protein VHE37_01725 [Nevskiaceae bacterium]|nr:hypothetical protein [Nevskiaceae bacterium]